MTNYDFWASYSFFDSPRISEKAAVDYLLKGTENPYAHDISDLSARVTLSALALLGDKEYARTGTRREAGGLSALYKQQSFQNYLQEQYQQYHVLWETSPDLELLPAGSFTISFGFTLTAPYISKDDTALHLLDNPVKKEWVFKLPYVAATQWKGALRMAVRQENGWDNNNADLLRLFGSANDNDGTGNNGRLYFYPTFFDQLSLEVINPHDRKTGAGSQPILMESVPSGTTGAFTLLYTPLDRIGKDEAETRQQIFADLLLVATGLEALFTLYGFGAKTSSGFGVADNAVEDGKLVLNIPDVTFSQDAAPQVQAPDDKYLTYLDETGQVKPAFGGSGEGGLLSNSEYREKGEQHGGGSLSEFRNFRRWYGEHGEKWQNQLQTTAAETTYPTINFESLSQLIESCQTLDATPVAATGGDA